MPKTGKIIECFENILSSKILVLLIVIYGMILFCKVYSRSKELNYFWVGSQRKNDQFWKFIDTNENYFPNLMKNKYAFPFFLNET